MRELRQLCPLKEKCCKTSFVPPSLFTLPTPLVPEGVTKHRADLPVLCGCFPLAIYFTFGSVYMSMTLSHFVPAYPSPSPCLQVRSLVGLRLYSRPAPKNIFLRTILIPHLSRQYCTKYWYLKFFFYCGKIYIIQNLPL